MGAAKLYGRGDPLFVRGGSSKLGAPSIHLLQTKGCTYALGPEGGRSCNLQASAFLFLCMICLASGVYALFGLAVDSECLGTEVKHRALGSSASSAKGFFPIWLLLELRAPEFGKLPYAYYRHSARNAREEDLAIA